MPGLALRLAGVFNPAARELIETQYQWQRPFVLDSKAATVAFGIEPVPAGDALREALIARRAGAPPTISGVDGGTSGAPGGGSPSGPPAHEDTT